MTDTPIIRAARALALKESGTDCYDDLDEGQQQTLQESVRAVLEAVREPSEAALRAGAAAIEDTDVWDETDTRPYYGAAWTPCAKSSWRAMIYAVLSE